MSTYPYGTASTGVFNILDTNFSPNDVVRGIRDNYSPVNRTTLLNSLGYQVGLIQNFVNASYLGRRDVPVQNAYMYSGWAEGSIMAYSGLVTDSTHYYSALYPTYIDVKEKTASICGHTYIKPASIEFKQFGTTALSGLFDLSGIYLNHLTFTDSASWNSFTSNWRVNRAHKLTIANPSYTDDSTGFSGILELYANKVEINSRSGLYLGSNAGSTNSYFTFCGANLFLLGPGNSSNIITDTNIFPFSNGEKELGDSSRYWKDIYGIKLTSVYTTTTSTFTTTVGGVCGSTGFTFESNVEGGGGLLASIGLYPNRVYFRRNDSVNMSGYFHINSEGQLEFYKIGTSGWVLTNF